MNLDSDSVASEDWRPDQNLDLSDSDSAPSEDWKPDQNLEDSDSDSQIPENSRPALDESDDSADWKRRRLNSNNSVDLPDRSLPNSPDSDDSSKWTPSNHNASRNSSALSGNEQRERPIPEELNPLEFVHIAEKEICDVAPQFGLTGDLYRMNFVNLENVVDAEKIVKAGLTAIIQEAYQDVEEGDRVGVAMSHWALDTEALVLFGEPKEVTVEKILETVMIIQQSKKDFNLDDEVVVKVVKIHPPKGAGYARADSKLFDEFFAQHSGGHGSTFIEIKNQDNLCLPRSIVTAKARYLHENTDVSLPVSFDTISRGDERRCTAQKTLAIELCQQAGILGLHLKKYLGIEELARFNKVLSESGFQLKVFSRKHYNAIIFDQHLPECAYLYLYHHEQHFTPMRTPRILVGRNYFCDTCDRGYNAIEEHKCKAICFCCKKTGFCPKEDNTLLECSKCNRRFYSRKCFENHQKSVSEKECDSSKKKKRRGTMTESICDRLVRCKDCYRTVRRTKIKGEDHHCGKKWCSICKTYDDIEKQHECFMQPMGKGNVNSDSEEEHSDIENDDDIDAMIRRHEDPEDGETELSREAHFSKHGQRKGKTPKFLFFDFETTQCTEVGKNQFGPILRHEPNYCVARKVCDLCKDYWLKKCEKCVDRSCPSCMSSRPECHTCHENKKTFSGPNVKDDFCKWLFSSENKGVTAIAHNAKGFDSQFILNWLAKEENHIAKVVPRGLSLLCVEAFGVRIIDSFSFLPMGLSSLPKSFGETELKKGFFPFLFCKDENIGYVGPWPDQMYYCSEMMKPKIREEFIDWYKDQEWNVFDYDKELDTYCNSDVDILLRCCMKFRDLFLKETGVDVFGSSITIASACNKVFRRNFLKPNTIGLIPPGGYRRNDKQSIVALTWLKWMSYKESCNIRHAKNGPEVRISGMKVDGFCEAQNTVYEFHGCYFHGCPCKTNRGSKIAGTNLTLEEAYQRTVDKSNRIKAEGYNLVEIFECQYYKELKANEEMRRFIESLDIVQPLDPRESFAGGRCNATRLWYKVQKGYRLNYYDVCSLYPFICKYGLFVIKHPEIITENFKEISKTSKPYLGLIKCTVLPPRKLLHPLLPYTADGKLTMPLCRTCVETKPKESCQHSDSERSLSSTWVSLELYKALDLGYVVTKIHEVWHYPESSQYDGVNDETGLFTKYINSFLRLKVQATDWPPWVKTDEDKDEFIRQYEELKGKYPSGSRND